MNYEIFFISSFIVWVPNSGHTLPCWHSRRRRSNQTCTHAIKKKHSRQRRAENKGLKQTRQLKCRRAAGKRRRQQSNAGISCSSLAPKLIVTPTPPTCTSLRHVGGATLLPRKLLPLLRQTTHLAAPPFTWSGEANGEKKLF